MHVATIWRYPVKSMAGEMLDEVAVGPLGLEGDRIVHVEDAQGRVVTARTHPRLLAHGPSSARRESRSWTAAHGSSRAS